MYTHWIYCQIGSDIDFLLIKEVNITVEDCWKRYKELGWRLCRSMVSRDVIQVKPSWKHRKIGRGQTCPALCRLPWEPFIIVAFIFSSHPDEVRHVHYYSVPFYVCNENWNIAGVKYWQRPPCSTTRCRRMQRAKRSSLYWAESDDPEGLCHVGVLW